MAQVKLGAGVPAHWSLLKRRLEAICPNSHGDYSLWRNTRRQDFQHPFLLQVTSYDRRGFLHGAHRALTTLTSDAEEEEKNSTAV